MGDSSAELRRRRWLANSLLAGAMMMCALLVVYPPGSAWPYPVCPIREYLHVDCAGCGATRALAELLRGRVAEAIRLNALFVILLPFGLWGAGISYWRAVRAGEFRWPAAPVPTVYAVLAVGAVFTVVRNIVG